MTAGSAPGPALILPGPARVTVRFQSGNLSVAARVLSVSGPTALVVVPETLPTAAARVTLLLDGREMASGTITVLRAAPGVFTLGGNGLGPAAAQNIDTPGVSTNGLTNPALPVSFVTLWLTGLGGAAAAEVTVELAGAPLPTAFVGRHPRPGLDQIDQINVRPPGNVAFGCYVPFTVRVGQAASNRRRWPSSTAHRALARIRWGFPTRIWWRWTGGNRS